MSGGVTTGEASVAQLRQKRQEFEERVRENERLAAADPEGYRRKLRWLVWLGYAYIGAMLVVVLLLTAALVAFVVFGHHLGAGVLKIGFLLAALLFGIVRSLWVKIDRPDDLLLTREQAPRLWQEVESIADRLGAPRPDEIRLDEEFNAAAAQWPRYGILGGYRSTLLVGLPLLASLSLDEARSVIAHEFGHFSGKHGRFAVWIYRVNGTWSQLGDNLSATGSNLFRPFVNWFNPRFAATSFALRRQHEYEADRAAAEIVGASVVAATLSRLDVLAEHQQRVFWSPFERETARRGRPASGFFSRFQEAIRQPLDGEAAKRRLGFALAQTTDYDDSHPALTDRLSALGETASAEVAPPPPRSAADELFGEALSSIATDLEEHYSAKMAPLWEMLAEQRRAQEKRRLELETEAIRRPLTEDEAVDLAYFQAENFEPVDALAAYRALYTSWPENATAAFLLGQALVEGDDAEGAPLLRAAAEKDKNFADPVRALLAGFHARQGDHISFGEIRDEAQEAHDRRQIAEASVAAKLADDLLPPDLTSEERTSLARTLRLLKGLGRAYAFRKRLPGTGEICDYLFLFPKAAAFVGENALAHFVNQFGKETELPRPFTIMAESSPKPWQKRLNGLEGALVYDYKDKV